MAKQTISDPRRKPRRENVAGDFFVDHTCIDCDTCRHVSPAVFGRAGEQSAVYKQPENEEERLASMQALLSCPTSSIHVNKVKKGEMKVVNASFPIPLGHYDGLYYNGFTDEKSFAASSYFIESPNGNVLVDCPRYNPALIKRFDELGGVAYIFLTHIDDVGDHARWAAHYNAKRIMHQEDVNYKTTEVEIKLKGSGPWTVGDDGDIEEMELIHTPGHTRGSVTLFHKASKSVFTGDHFAYSNRAGGLSIFPVYNDFSREIQYENVRMLLDYDFLHVLPGHGRRVDFANREERDERILAFLAANNH